MPGSRRRSTATSRWGWSRERLSGAAEWKINGAPGEGAPLFFRLLRRWGNRGLCGCTSPQCRGEAPQPLSPHRVSYPHRPTEKWRKPKKDRHLRGPWKAISWAHRRTGTVCDLRSWMLPSDVFGWDIGGDRRRNKGSGDRRSWWPPSPSRRSQSRAPSAPIRRLGVQCEGVVRDPLRLAALAVTNQVGPIIRPGDGSRGLRWPSRAAQQPTGGGGEKNGGATPDLG